MHFSSTFIVASSGGDYSLGYICCLFCIILIFCFAERIIFEDFSCFLWKCFGPAIPCVRIWVSCENNNKRPILLCTHGSLNRPPLGMRSNICKPLWTKALETLSQRRQICVDGNVDVLFSLNSRDKIHIRATATDPVNEQMILLVAEGITTESSLLQCLWGKEKLG